MPFASLPRLPRRGSADRYRLLLALAFVISVFCQLGNSFAAFDELRNGTRLVRGPFQFGFRMRVISGITPEAASAGVHWGDTLEQVGGQAFSGMRVLDDVIARARPGDVLPVVVRRPDGSTTAAAIRLAAERSAPASATAWVVAFALQAFMPAACLALGFWVAFLRPGDVLAWLLLGLLIGFSQFVNGFSWNWPGETAALIWYQLTGNPWGVWLIWLVCFALMFPERARFDREHPWIKWLLIGPLILLTMVMFIFFVVREHSFAAVAWLRPVLNFVLAYRVNVILSMLAISVFFSVLWYNGATALTRDGRRRLKITYFGTALSLTPLLIVVIISIFKGSDPLTGLPEWAVITTLLFLPLFPVTLAYVIVVQRAMELRVALRQSAKYTIAKGGFWLLRAGLISVAVILIRRAFSGPHPRVVDQVAGYAAIAGVVLLRRRFSEKVSLWMDRRFFREAYSSDQVLSNLSETARRFSEAEPLLATVSRSICETLHVSRAAVLLRKNGGYCVTQTLGAGSVAGTCLPAGGLTIAHLQSDNRPALVYFDDPNSWVRSAGPEEAAKLRTLDAELLLPLSGREELLGVMAFGPKRSEEPYSTSDLSLLQSVAAQTGLTLENSLLMAAVAAETGRRERLNREVEIAREVQERLFPSVFPPVPGIDYFGLCRPAQAVGGDYFDFLHRGNGRLGIAIGDVSGKGISAALMMASLHSQLRGQAVTGFDDLARLIGNINRLTFDYSTSNRYITFFYGEYDPQTRRLEFVNAGHNAPMILRGNEVIRLEASGPVVGLLKSATYESAVCQMQPGDVFIGYTDGISESMTADDEEWGEERLVADARECSSVPAAAMGARLLAAATAFAAGAEQYDDMTLVVMKVLP